MIPISEIATVKINLYPNRRNYMKLFFMAQSENIGFETYDSCVVAASCEDEAKKIHPSGIDMEWWWSNWASDPENVTCIFIGVSNSEVSGVVIASYNAG